MAEENEVKNEEVKTNTETQQEEKKTFTLEEVQNLLNAKNHEKEARKNAESEVKSLKEELAKLKGEDSVSKFKEDEFNQLKAQLDALQKEKDELETKAKNNALKDELRKFAGLNQAAIDDVLDKAIRRGFKKSDEVGLYLDKNGKTLTDFEKDMKENYSYYFGIAQNKNVIPDSLRESIEKAKKTGSTISIIQEGFKNYKPNL